MRMETTNSLFTEIGIGPVSCAILPPWLGEPANQLPGKDPPFYTSRLHNGKFDDQFIIHLQELATSTISFSDNNFIDIL